MKNKNKNDVKTVETHGRASLQTTIIHIRQTTKVKKNGVMLKWKPQTITKPWPELLKAAQADVNKVVFVIEEQK